MTESTSAPNGASTTVTYRVTYEHDLARWTAMIMVGGRTADGATFSAGSLRREFGPFDDHVTVAQWLAREVHGYTKTQTAETITPPQDPPQGRTQPRADGPGL